MNFDQLITRLRELDQSLKRHVSGTANLGLTLRNWIVGAYLVEFEQNGEERAEYGDRLIPELAAKLDIKGLSSTILKHCRTFYRTYPEIRQSLTGEFDKLLEISGLKIRRSATGDSDPPSLVPVKEIITRLTFTHIVELLRFEDPLQRGFYAAECIRGGWSVRELKRQIGSLLFERLGLSNDKEKLLRLTSEELAPPQPADIIKDPYVFEFLGLTPKEAFRENDLETANYYRKHEMAEGDNPPVGLLLCTDKDHTLVEYALGGMDENLFVSAYKVALPKPEKLEAFLLRESKNLPES